MEQNVSDPGGENIPAISQSKDSGFESYYTSIHNYFRQPTVQTNSAINRGANLNFKGLASSQGRLAVGSPCSVEISEPS